VEPSLHSVGASDAALAERLDAAVYDHRNVLAFVPVALAWWATSRPSGTAALGLAAALVCAGAALRAWATLHNRYAQGAERKTLATGGPYSWCRNPLYVANGLVLLGGFAASGLFAWLPAAAAWFALVYARTVRHEERRLETKYGAAYAAYVARVPRWLPVRRGERPHVAWRLYLPALAVQARALVILAPFLLRR
jgi:protein-S-isoprenylcysteine O-methyltransferase Ste14